MWGAIIGDLVGSIHEYSQVRNITEIQDDIELITADSFFSDDTILTIAIIDAIINDKNYEKYLRKYGLEYIDYKPNYTPYFSTSFSLNFIKWLKKTGANNSRGNGAMMRISPIGFLFNSEEEVIEHSRLATIPSHNSKESIDCATIIARVIFLARKGYKKNEIQDVLNLKIAPNSFVKFNTTCYDTINNCLYAVFSSNTYEESIHKILRFGGDTDTNACIVGGMAEAMYGVNKFLIEQVKFKIPSKFVKKLELAYKLMK